MTVKELLLRVEGKLDGFIASHEARHSAESHADQLARGDPTASAAGRALNRLIGEVTDDVKGLTLMVDGHDRTLQRVMGAVGLVSLLGIGTLGLVLARIVGVVP